MGTSKNPDSCQIAFAKPLIFYVYEGVPSILERAQITAVLASTSMDTTAAGLRDYAILQILATYGLRASEVRNMRIEDIDWRAEAGICLDRLLRSDCRNPLWAARDRIAELLDDRSHLWIVANSPCHIEAVGGQLRHHVHLKSMMMAHEHVAASSEEAGKVFQGSGLRVDSWSKIAIIFALHFLGSDGLNCIRLRISNSIWAAF